MIEQIKKRMEFHTMIYIADSSSGYLDQKLVAGTGIDTEVVDNNGSKQLKISLGSPVNADTLENHDAEFFMERDTGSIIFSYQRILGGL